MRATSFFRILALGFAQAAILCSSVAPSRLFARPMRPVVTNVDGTSGTSTFRKCFGNDGIFFLLEIRDFAKIDKENFVEMSPLLSSHFPSEIVRFGMFSGETQTAASEDIQSRYFISYDKSQNGVFYKLFNYLDYGRNDDGKFKIDEWFLVEKTKLVPINCSNISITEAKILKQ